MAQIADNSARFGAIAQGTLDGGADAAIKAADGTLKGSFKAQGIMTEAVIKAGSEAATNASYNQGNQQAGNK